MATPVTVYPRVRCSSGHDKVCPPPAEQGHLEVRLNFSKDEPAVGYQAANQTNDVFGQRRSLGSSRVVFPSSALNARACSL